VVDEVETVIVVGVIGDDTGVVVVGVGSKVVSSSYSVLIGRSPSKASWF
jgi:hypothetical protein